MSTLTHGTHLDYFLHWFLNKVPKQYLDAAHKRPKAFSIEISQIRESAEYEIKLFYIKRVVWKTYGHSWWFDPHLEDVPF